MQLDQWLREVYEEEVLTKEASNMEALFDQMNPSDLLDIACGRTTIEKVAATMTMKRREALPAKSFAVPESKAKKIGVAGEIKGEAKGKYPIPDAKHARNALARVAQKGTPAEKALVEKKVHSKFPGIGKTASAKLAFVDRVARELARTHHQVKLAQEEAAAKAEEKKCPECDGKGCEKCQSEKTGAARLVERVKRAGCMTKQDEFTTPEAQQKAKVMSKAMQLAKGAPAPTRKKAVAAAGKVLTRPMQ